MCRGWFDRAAMDQIRELFEAANQRLRAPFFGYISLAAVALNWQSLFYLLFSNTSAFDRIAYVESTTTFWSVLVLPILLGVALALSAPWVSFAGAAWAETPTQSKKLREIRTEVRIQSEKNRLQEEQTKRIENVIETAEQEARAKNIEDSELREQLLNEINNLKEKNTVLQDSKATDRTLLKQFASKWSSTKGNLDHISHGITEISNHAEQLTHDLVAVHSAIKSCVDSDGSEFLGRQTEDKNDHLRRLYYALAKTDSSLNNSSEIEQISTQTSEAVASLSSDLRETMSRKMF